MSTERAKDDKDKLDTNLEYAFEHKVNFEARVVLLSGEVDDAMFDLVDTAFTELERRNHKSITVRLNSLGGDELAALGIVGRFKASSARVVVEGYGAIQSAAMLIMASGGKRRISRFAWGMHHESSYDIGGRHQEVKAHVEQREREDDQWAEAMAEFTHKNKQYWKEMGVGTDAYYTADQMVELGVADEVF